LFEYEQRVELVSRHLVQSDLHAEFQCGVQVDCVAKQQAKIGCLGRVEPIQRAVITAAAIVGSIRAEPWVAELPATQRPVDQESQGGLFGPLPGTQFGSEFSSKAASSASMAAFAATAWWMMGTPPA